MTSGATAKKPRATPTRETTRRIEQLNDRAMADYDALELVGARGQLFEALNLARGASLKDHTPLVRTYMNLGVVLGAGFNDRETAIAYFGEALRLDPNVRPDRKRANPLIQSLFAESADRLRQQAASEPGSASQPAGPKRRTIARQRQARSRRLRRVRRPRKVRLATPPRRPRPKVSVSLMAGVGLGLVVGGQSEGEHPLAGGEAGKVDVATGFALAPFHLASEVGYQITERWLVSGLLRLQLVNGLEGETTESHVSVLGLARAQLSFGHAAYQPYVSFGAGGGMIRHRVPLDDYDNSPTTPDGIVDARISGVAAVGAGGGLRIRFTDHLGWQLDVTLLALFPDFAAHVDFNTGLTASF